MLESGGATWEPTFVPSPSHLGLAATVLVHPTTTTRATTTEEKEAPSVALRLLRLINMHVGSVAARVNIAFSFDDFAGRRLGDDDDEASNDKDMKLNGQHADETTTPINVSMAHSHSLWSRAEDFWHAVGWAFNCSILYPERWDRWRLWLEYMCEVMERDWNERVEQLEAVNEAAKEVDNVLIRESLIFTYLTSGSVAYGGKRRIFRAVFADGDAASLSEFREVFKNELKKPAQEGAEKSSRKRAKEVNVDDDEYRGYLINDLDEAESEKSAELREEKLPKRRSKRSKRTTKRFSDLGTDGDEMTSLDMADQESRAHLLGGFSSLGLRQRILRLLSNVASRLPNEFVTIEDLYHLIVESVRHLPLPIFQAFVSPSMLPYLSVDAQTTLCEYLLVHMIEVAAPDMNEEDGMTQGKVQTCFLPFAASNTGVADNAKVSIMLESLLFLLLEKGMLTLTPELRQAVEKGNAARAKKAQAESRKNRRVEDVEESWLSESAYRLTLMANDFCL